jgi:hypothetical protein
MSLGTEIEAAIDQTDREWLDAIGEESLAMFGKPWEDRDGETASEGRKANIQALFRQLEVLKLSRAAAVEQEQRTRAECNRLRGKVNAVGAALEKILNPRLGCNSIIRSSDQMRNIARQALAALREP